MKSNVCAIFFRSRGCFKRQDWWRYGINRIVKFFRLPATDRDLLLQAFFWQLVFRVIVPIVQFPSIRRFLGRFKSPHLFCKTIQKKI